MAKVKISATVTPDRLDEARRLTGRDSVSEVLDLALLALIERELEQIHAGGYERIPQGDETVTSVDPTVWADLPWDDE